MKKLLIKDLYSFRTWQHEVSRNIDSEGQRTVSSMADPTHFPVVLMWLISDFIDFNSKNLDPTDQLEYKYIYIEDFPVKELKRGMYVYQVVRTSEGMDALLEH